jgi:hypothetical protein
LANNEENVGSLGGAIRSRYFPVENKRFMELFAGQQEGGRNMSLKR